ncbi:hypothetical protein PACTADRAFT_185823 [Pachysolen tannophilus NRRL Y-2460]|uniref:Uncharacterized protein n=1 Tax=Pachysolen tannophilus NRRL Y-2460 TaxID=669874 RepID=A0A1E4U1J5_PACTA|nr:hypothetical protein PACTADRAFT_185823 [Pachysolen tannophilus NRRL Y-2460]
MFGIFENSQVEINKILVQIDLDERTIPLAGTDQQEHNNNNNNNNNNKSSDNNDVRSDHSNSSATPAMQLLQSIRESQIESDEDESELADDGNDSFQSTKTKKLNIDLLNKLLLQPSLVQEVDIGKNQKLLTYICRDDVLNVLIDNLIESVPFFEKLFYEDQNETPNQTTQQLDDQESLEESPDDQYRRRATTSGELLALKRVSAKLLTSSTDKTIIKRQQFDNFKLLSKIWNSILDKEFTVDNLANVSLFISIIESLIDLNVNEFMNFIRQNQENRLLVDQILKHVKISPFMDLLIKFISYDKSDSPIGLIEILKEQNLILKLLDLLKTDSIITQTSIGDFLKNLITISANTPALYDVDPENANSSDSSLIGPNDLTRALISEEGSKRLFYLTLSGGHALTTCVGIIIEVIRKNNSDYDSIDVLDDDYSNSPPSSRDPIYLGVMLARFSSGLKILTDRYLKNYEAAMLPTTIGELEPVGFERFKIVELIAELLHCSNMHLMNNMGSDEIIKKRERFRNNKFELMTDALNKSITDERLDFMLDDLETDEKSQHTVNDLTSKFSSSLGSGVIGGGDGSKSLVDVEKLTNEIRNFSINEDSEKNANTSSDEVPIFDEYPSKELTIGDFFKKQLIKANVLKFVLDMLKKFPWNNFLHNVIFDIAQQVFNGRFDNSNTNKFLIHELFKKDRCFITNLIIDRYNDSVEAEKNLNLRLGYMGHLILISEELVKFSSLIYTNYHSFPEKDENTQKNDTFESKNSSDIIIINQEIYDIINEDNWVNFVNKELAFIRDAYNQVLGGIKPEDCEPFVNPNAILLGNGETTGELAVEDNDDYDDNSNLIDSINNFNGGNDGREEFEDGEDNEDYVSNDDGMLKLQVIDAQGRDIDINGNDDASLDNDNDEIDDNNINNNDNNNNSNSNNNNNNNNNAVEEDSGNFNDELYPVTSHNAGNDKDEIQEHQTILSVNRNNNNTNNIGDNSN